MKNKSILIIVLCVFVINFSVADSAVETHNKHKMLFVDVIQAIPSVTYDIRYASENNFVGEVIAGYLAKKCYLHHKVINDLKAASADFAQQDYRLKLFDCYRPEKAVAHFMRWAQDSTSTQTKSRYYPNLPKSNLAGVYIAEKSGHSKGYTLDLTLEKKHASGIWQALDMGAKFDLFDVISNTSNKQITPQQSNNRYLLKTIMQAHGFSAYDMEWWHFTHTKTPKSQRQQSYNFDVE